MLSMKCLVCGKLVVEMDIKGCWDGGLVEWVTAGYGSIHDCDRFLICICDQCVKEKLCSK